MNEPQRCGEVSLDDFTRRFALRAKSLMWFLGAGASASAGIPTASDLIWEFKQKLFVSQRRVPRQAVEDLGSPAVRDQLQAHIDSLRRLPGRDSPDEYAALFESVYPAESDRSTFLASKIGGASPSYGHVVLGALMRAELTPLVWTTNFDPLVADACARVFGGTGDLTSVDLDRPHLGEEAVSSQRWPVEIKLHGDFRSKRLKNTPDELRQQDARLRQLSAPRPLPSHPAPPRPRWPTSKAPPNASASYSARLADAKREIARLIDALADSEDSGSGQPGGQRDVTVLSSLPGVGQTVLATLLAEAPQALARRDHKALRCLTGVAPVTRRSGKYKLVVRRMAAHARLRDAVYHWARVAVQRDAVSKAKYAALRGRGHGHARALRSVADRLLAVACAMLRTQTCYRPTHPAEENAA